MKVQTIVNSKWEPEVLKIMIPLEGGGGDAGRQAVAKLTELIEGIKGAETGEEVLIHYYAIVGYGLCCRDCGFLKEKSLDDLMHLVQHIVDNELHRVSVAGEG